MNFLEMPKVDTRIVPVDGRQEAEEFGEGGTPVGPLQVVAGAVCRAVDEGAARASLRPV